MEEKPHNEHLKNLEKFFYDKIMSSVNIVTKDENCEQKPKTSEIKTENPWPYINKFYTFIKKVQGNNYKFQCELCLPEVKYYNANSRSLYNLKKHIELKHPSAQVLFETTIKLSSNYRNELKRALWSERTSKKPCTDSDLQQVNGLCNTNSSSTVTQDKLDELVTGFVIDEMLPISIVESPALKNLINTLQPSKSVLSTERLTSVIADYYNKCKINIKKKLDDVDYVATTATSWSYQNRCYVAVLVHWIDRGTYARENALLACQYIKDRLTYDSLIRELQKIHDQFGIRNKTVKITTSNGPHFPKSLMSFNGNETCTKNMCSELLERDDMFSYETDDDVSFVNIFEILSNERGISDAWTPQIHQCALDILNVVVLHDAEKALQDCTFCKASRSAFNKANVLWKKENVANVQKLNQRLVPRSTSWNAIYDAVSCINAMISTNGSDIHHVCDNLGVPRFTSSDITFFKEYVSVMKSVAQMRDVLHRPSFYMGCLLPSITICLSKLRKVQEKSLQFCLPLTKALISGMETRYQTIMNDENYILASAFHPRFKLSWLENDRRVLVMKKMISMLENTSLHVQKLANEVLFDHFSDSEDDDFFHCLDKDLGKQKETNFIKQVASFISLQNSRQIQKSAFPGDEFEKVFLQLNTPIPSTAGLKKNLGLVKDILHTKRRKLTENEFDKLLFLKINKRYLSIEPA